jgi:hypothetical protein
MVFNIVYYPGLPYRYWKTKWQQVHRDKYLEDKAAIESKKIMKLAEDNPIGLSTFVMITEFVPEFYLRGANIFGQSPDLVMLNQRYEDVSRVNNEVKNYLIGVKKKAEESVATMESSQGHGSH